MIQWILRKINRYLSSAFDGPDQRRPQTPGYASGGIVREKDEEGYGPGKNPKYNRDIVRLSAEQTADWLSGGGVPWSQGLVDPAERMKFDQEKREIQMAVSQAREQGLEVAKVEDALRFVDILIASLPNSPSTRQELERLRNAYLDVSVRNDTKAEGAVMNLLAIKIHELVQFAYSDA